MYRFLEQQTYENHNELKSSPPKLDDSRKEVPETVYVNIWNADNGELKLAEQKSVFVDQLEHIQQHSDTSHQERHQDQATPSKVLWRPQYSEAVGGVGNSNQGEPPSPPSFVNNFYQNLQDKPDQASFSVVSSGRLTDPGLWQQIPESNAVLDHQRKFGKFGSTRGRPGLETPVSLASLMSEAAAESNPSYRPSLPPYSWGPREETESLPTLYHPGGNTNQQQQVRTVIISTRGGWGGETSLLWVSAGKFHA